MKLQPIRLANAFAISQGILSVLCALVSFAAPGFVVGIAKALPHALDLSPLVPEQQRAFQAGEFFLGLASWMVLAWVAGWLLAVVHNALPFKAESYNEQLRTRTQ